MAKITTLEQVGQGDTVEIVSVSNNQCYQKAGDGEEFFIGRTATVKTVESLEKIWVEPAGLGNVLWFVAGDLLTID